MANQATEVPEDVGKMLTLTHNFAKHMIVPGEAAVVHRHVVVNGKTSLNKTDLLILSVAEAARVMAEDTKKMRTNSCGMTLSVESRHSQCYVSKTTSGSKLTACYEFRRFLLDRVHEALSREHDKTGSRSEQTTAV